MIRIHGPRALDDRNFHRTSQSDSDMIWSLYARILDLCAMHCIKSKRDERKPMTWRVSMQRQPIGNGCEVFNCWSAASFRRDKRESIVGEEWCPLPFSAFPPACQLQPAPLCPLDREVKVLQHKVIPHCEGFCS